MVRLVLVGIILFTSCMHGSTPWDTGFDELLQEYTTQQRTKTRTPHALNRARLNLARHILDPQASFYDHALATQLLHAVINSSTDNDMVTQAQTLVGSIQ